MEWSDLLWSHKISGMNLNVDLEGKKINTYNLINTYDSNYLGGVFSMNQGTYGTIIHELCMSWDYLIYIVIIVVVIQLVFMILWLLQ